MHEVYSDVDYIHTSYRGNGDTVDAGPDSYDEDMWDETTSMENFLNSTDTIFNTDMNYRMDHQERGCFLIFNMQVH